MKTSLQLISLLILISCQPTKEAEPIQIEILDPIAEKFIDQNTSLDTLASGFNWSEGPLYVAAGDFWLFSDVPENKIFKIQGGQTSTYLEPSGFTGSQRGGELGSNGLLLNEAGELVMMQHGDRRVAKMKASIDQPVSAFETVIDTYEEKKFNSPNDGVFDRNGNLYFTDPPYGLENGMQDSTKELSYQGVYCLLTSGELVLVDSLTRPNGITLSPDETQLLVANSDPNRAIWYAYELDEPGVVKDRSVFYDATPLVGSAGNQGLPDGMKMHPSGFLFASGPGGLWIFNETGKPVARIYTGQATSNCAFSDDWRTLMITADAYIFAIALQN